MGTTPFVWITASLVPETLLMFGLIKGYKQEVSVTAVTSTDESLPRLLRRNILAHNYGKRQDMGVEGRILASWVASRSLYIVGLGASGGALFWWLSFRFFFVLFCPLGLIGPLFKGQGLILGLASVVGFSLRCILTNAVPLS